MSAFNYAPLILGAGQAMLGFFELERITHHCLR